MPHVLTALYPYAWFVGAALAAVTYCIGMRETRR